MPAEIGEPLGESDDIVNSRARRQMPHVVEAGATQTGGIEPLELGVRNRQWNERNAFVGATRGTGGIGRNRIVKAVAGWLHDHAMLDAKPRVQSDKHFLG